jgi:hypothetical protein
LAAFVESLLAYTGDLTAESRGRSIPVIRYAVFLQVREHSAMMHFNIHRSLAEIVCFHFDLSELSSVAYGLPGG